MKKSNVCSEVLKLAEPIADQNGCEIYDIEFKKEGSDYYLRIFIDLKDREKKVSLDECEAVSRALSEVLDDKDPIEQAYMLEVSSPGLDRQLKTEQHFKRFEGSKVDVGLYKAVNGTKCLTGTLSSFEDATLTLMLDSEEFKIALSETTFVKLSLEDLF